MTKKKIIGRHDKVMDLTYGKKYNPKDKINAAASGDWLSDVGSLMGGATGILKGYVDNSTTKKREDLEDEARRAMSETFNGIQSVDALQAAREAYAPMPYVRKKDLIPTTKERIGNDIAAVGSGIAAGAQTGQWWAAAGLGLAGLLGGELGYKNAGNKADKQLNSYSTLKDSREERLDKAYRHQLGNIYGNTYNRLMANYSDAGGQLGGNRYKSGVGSVAVPDIFTHGGIFSNGMELINAGGSHEENPNGGVTVSYDEQGVPNLVEEGEVIFNDYVFSNRFAPTKELLEKYNLPTAWDKYTFARIAENMGKESRERPNDPISKRGLESSMDTLSAMQEEYKETERQKEIAKAIKRMTPEEKAAMFDAASQQMQEQYGTPEDMYDAQMSQEMPVEGMEETPAFMNISAFGGPLEKANIFGTADKIKREVVGYDTHGKPIYMYVTTNAGKYATYEEAVRGQNRHDIKTVRREKRMKLSDGRMGYKTSDGQEFVTKEAAKQHQKELNSARDTFESEHHVHSATDKINLGDAGVEAVITASKSKQKTDGVRAGSATKAAETEVDPLQRIVDDTATRSAKDVETYLAGIDKRRMNNPEIFEWNSNGIPAIQAAAKAAGDLQGIRNLQERQNFVADAKKRYTAAREAEQPSGATSSSGRPTGLRYAGALASGLGAIASLFEEPDYTHAEQIRRAGRPYGEVTFKPVENYMTFQPIDRNYLLNQIRNNSLGLSRQLVNSSGANPTAATQGLVALNYGTGQNIGQGLIQADLANRQLEERARTFNRATDQYKSEGMFKESAYNRDRFQPLTQPEILAAQMEAEEDAYLASARSQGLTNFSDALTGIGEDNMAYNMAMSAPWLYYDYTDNPFRAGVQRYKKTVACGGNMKSRKRRK